MELSINNGKEVVNKTTQNKSIVFNVLLEEGTYAISLKGFRYLYRCISPPSVRIKGGYTQTVHITEDIYKGIYEAVKQELWGKDILPVEEAFMGEFLNSKSLSRGGF